MASPRKTASGRWTVQIEIAGRRESGTFDTKAQATTWAARRSTELRAMRGSGAGRVMTLRDAMRRYANEVSPTKKGERFERVRLAAFEKPDHAPLPVDRKLADITAADLAAWRDSRMAMVARGSVLRDMTLLGSVLEVARREWGWVEVNVMRDVRRPAEPDHRERVIAGWEARRMVRQLGLPVRQADGRRRVRSVSEAVAVAFVVALATGMRAGELCGLRWDDVGPDVARITDGKTGRREVPLTRAARRLIEMCEGFDAELVFGLKSQTLDALFRRARDRAGLSGFTFHDSRRTAATRISQRIDVMMLCRMFGWRDPKMAMVYYAPKSSDISLLIDQFK